MRKENKDESAKIVFIKGGVKVDDDYHDDGHIGVRLYPPSRRLAATSASTWLALVWADDLTR